MSSSYTSSSLTLRAILKTAAGRLGMGVPGRQVSGLTPPAKALFAAVAASRGPVVLVAPTDADVELLTADVRFFVAAYEGLSDDEVERSVLPFPSHEVDPYRGMAPHFDIASARARALHALTTGAARVIVASAASLLPRLAAPQRLRRPRWSSLRASTSRPPISRISSRPPATPGRTRSTSPASSASAAASSISIRPARSADPARVRGRHDRVDPGLRPVDAALDRRRRSGSDRAADGAPR